MIVSSEIKWLGDERKDSKIEGFWGFLCIFYLKFLFFLFLWV